MRFRTFAAIALGAVALLGVSRLWEPFGGDQALFLIGATAMHRGAILYRDFWDLKQPGIYEFYLVAGTLLGFTPMAIHVAELTLWLVLSVVQIVALAPVLRRPAFAAVAPLATAGAFYFAATIHDFGQPEALAGPFLFFGVWLFIVAIRRKRWSVALASAGGFLCGLAVLGKLLFAAIALVTIAGATIEAGVTGSTVLNGVFFACAACVSTATYVVASIADRDAGLVMSTWFAIPRQIVAELPLAPVTRLVQSTKWYLESYAIPLSLAVPSLAYEPKGDGRIWRAAMIWWIAAVPLEILVQRFSWWEYHFMLFVVPVGVLATFGCDALGEWLARAPASRRAAAVALGSCVALVFALRPAVRAARRVETLAVTRAPFSTAGAERYRRRESSEYDGAATVAAFVADAPRAPASVFVAGDPIILMLSKSISTVPINGWGFELLLPWQWRDLRSELESARPSDVFVDPSSAALIAKYSLGIESYLRQKYDVASYSPLGTWYRRTAGAPQPSRARRSHFEASHKAIVPNVRT